MKSFITLGLGMLKPVIWIITIFKTGYIEVQQSKVEYLGYILDVIISHYSLTQCINRGS